MNKRKIYIMILVITLIILSSISCKKDNPVAPPPTADFTITLQAFGQVVYSSGIIVGANYLVKATLKELTGVGAQILSVKTTFVDSYGNTYTFNYTGVDFFSGGYISGKNQIIGTANPYIGLLHLAAAKTVQMSIEFLDDNQHHITKTAQSSVQW